MMGQFRGKYSPRLAVTRRVTQDSIDIPPAALSIGLMSEQTSQPERIDEGQVQPEPDAQKKEKPLSANEAPQAE